MTLALLFSPQGSQVVGMGRELAEHSAGARAVLRGGPMRPWMVLSDAC